MAAELLDAFREAYIRNNEAFNRHEFASAFAGLPEDMEWHPVRNAPGTPPMRGREEIIRAFDGLLSEFPDWQVDPQEFIAAAGAMVVRLVATGTGLASGATVRQPFTQVWELQGGSFIRVREYFDHAEALEAVGLRE
jgi:ketosteroid isomerase-like protein